MKKGGRERKAAREQGRFGTDGPPLARQVAQKLSALITFRSDNLEVGRRHIRRISEPTKRSWMAPERTTSSSTVTLLLGTARSAEQRHAEEGQHGETTEDKPQNRRTPALESFMRPCCLDFAQYRTHKIDASALER